MLVKINGEPKEFEKGVSLSEILSLLQIQRSVMAIAVNTKVVKKNAWADFKPTENDEIECLKFVGGG